MSFNISNFFFPRWSRGKKKEKYLDARSMQYAISSADFLLPAFEGNLGAW